MINISSLIFLNIPSTLHRDVLRKYFLILILSFVFARADLVLGLELLRATGARLGGGCHWRGRRGGSRVHLLLGHDPGDPGLAVRACMRSFRKSPRAVLGRQRAAAARGRGQRHLEAGHPWEPHGGGRVCNIRRDHQHYPYPERGGGKVTKIGLKKKI
jgi:hypothetical protein